MTNPRPAERLNRSTCFKGERWRVKGGSLRVWVSVVSWGASTGGRPMEMKCYDFKVTINHYEEGLTSWKKKATCQLMHGKNQVGIKKYKPNQSNKTPTVVVIFQDLTNVLLCFVLFYSALLCCCFVILCFALLLFCFTLLLLFCYTLLSSVVVLFYSALLNFALFCFALIWSCFFCFAMLCFGLLFLFYFV